MCCPSQVSVATRNVHSCTLIQSPRSKTVPGMTEASANTVRPAHMNTPAALILTPTKHTVIHSPPCWFKCLHQQQSSLFTFSCGSLSIFHLPVTGPDCRHRHTRRVICMNYLVGFCPEGKSCKFMQYVILFYIL